MHEKPRIMFGSLKELEVLLHFIPHFAENTIRAQQAIFWQYEPKIHKFFSLGRPKQLLVQVVKYGI